MRTPFRHACSVLALSATAAIAGPREDAAFIVDQHRPVDETVARFDAMTIKIIDDLEGALGAFGARILDRDAFTIALSGRIRQATLEQAREIAIQSYLDTLTPEELDEIAGLYRSSLGQGLVDPERRGPLWQIRMLLVDVSPLQVIEEHNEELMRPIAAHSDDALAVIESQFSFSRIARLVARPDLVAFEDEAIRAQLVGALHDSSRPDQ